MKRNFVLLCIGLSTLLLPAQISYTLNEGWRFHCGDLDKGEQSVAAGEGWTSVVIPHTWNGQDAIDDIPGFYRGTCWYRRVLTVPQSERGKVVYLIFDGANQELELFVNGKRVGEHLGGYSRATFDITDFLHANEVANDVAVRLTNRHNPDIPPLSADFTFFGGIYRNVSVAYFESLHLSLLDYGSEGLYVHTSEVSEQGATVRLEAVVRQVGLRKQRATVEHIIYAPSGEEVASVRQTVLNKSANAERVQSVPIQIDRPQLWSPESPNLYVVRTLLRDAKGRVAFEKRTTFGLRWFAFSAEEGFVLNGRPLKLIGTNRHQCFPDKGWALPDELHLRDVELLKRMGGNFLRVSHYPQDRTVMEACDRLGIITSVEIPVVNAITESEAFLSNSLQQTVEMVRQNYNYASVVVWCYMNEVMLRPPFKENADRHRLYCNEVNRQARAIEELIRKEDPSRYTMIPFHGNLKAYEAAGLPEIPLLVGWNLYLGWYEGLFSGFEEFLDHFHLRYPQVPVIITEYGADVDDRLHSFAPTRFDYTMEYSNLYHEHYLDAILCRSFVTGATIWNLNDFYSEVRGDALPHVNGKGINTLHRQPKDVYLMYETRFNPDPAIRIGQRSWFNRSGVDMGDGTSSQPMTVYTNLPEIELFLNGRLLGRHSALNGRIKTTIPYVEGRNVLVARGKRGGDVVEDAYECRFSMIPRSLKKIESKRFQLNVMLGGNRYFEDREGALCWLPEQEYRMGEWGYVGGRRFAPKAGFGVLPASPLNILNTQQDPLFQSQRQGLSNFRADVPKGRYAVYLYWAELIPSTQTETLVYNLGNDVQLQPKGERLFHVEVNGRRILSDFDVEQEAGGAARPIVKRIYVDVWGDEGLTVDLIGVKGETILNAIRIVSID